MEAIGCRVKSATRNTPKVYLCNYQTNEITKIIEMMRKSIALFVFLLMALSSIGQVKLARQAEKVESVAFDYTKNWQGEHYRNYIGQSLYVIPKTELLAESGYENFYEKPNGSVYQPNYESFTFSRNTRTEALANKTLKVEDAVTTGRDILGRQTVFLKLSLDTDTLYYKYDFRYEHNFPFIVLGYLEKLKADNIGKNFCLANCLGSKISDYITGKEVILTPGTLWTCTDIVLDTEFGILTKLFTNEKGETIRDWVKFIPEDYKNQLDKKYGKTLVQAAINGEIQKGMSKELVKVAFGEPEKINNASYGEQWVYSSIYVYFKNGKVSGWN